MAASIVETKLFAPAPRAGAVLRPRLATRLDRAGEARLVLVSAPPGFGKSSLLAQWLAADPDRRASAAWVSLDDADNEPARFWSHVAASLERVVPEVAGARVTSGTEPIASLVDELLNVLHASGSGALLVLDDYHVIEAEGIHAAMAYLIERLPPRSRVVLSTRVDPPLPLPRLRVRGDLVEIRARDLRFTDDEAVAYLNGTMGLTLSPGDVEALEERTEGWIAALQLAALSIQGRSDASSFIAGFAGDDRYVVDYLVDEVLARQPEPVQSFLLQTSILERLSGALCDAVTGRTDGREVLLALDRANLFLIPLDERRSWYRYHHLFADVLRARLADEPPGIAAQLHRRASAWFEQAGAAGDAIHHALAAEDVGRAAALIEHAAHDLRATRQEATLRRWLDELPDEAFDARPVIAIAHAGALLATGETRGVAQRLDQASRWSSAASGDEALADALGRGMLVERTDVLGHLPSAIGLYRSGLARMRGDASSSAVHARSVLDATGDDLPLERGGAAGLLGLALWSAGDLEAAHAAWSDAVGYLLRAGHEADVLGCSIALAEIRQAQGRLADAERTYEQGLRLGQDAPGGPLRGTVDMQVGLAGLALERDDRETARGWLAAAESLGADKGLPQSAHRRLVASARLRWAEGDLEGAVEDLDEAERRFDPDMFPDVRPIAAVRARVWVAQGRLDRAAAWARTAGVSPSDDLVYVREYEHVTLARLLVAVGVGERSGALAEGLALSERLAAAAGSGGREGSLLDILVVLARGRLERGDRPGATDALAQAAGLAAPQGWVRPFLEEPGVASLGTDLAGDEAAFVRRILAGTTPDHRRARSPRMPEPLSERELEVLRMLRSDLDGPAIARHLHISLNTLRTHTKSIYSKLGVSDRRAAIRAAEALRLA